MFRRLKEDLYQDIKGLVISNNEEIKSHQEKECNKIYEKLTEQLTTRQNDAYVGLSAEIARQLQEM